MTKIRKDIPKDEQIKFQQKKDRGWNLQECKLRIKKAEEELSAAAQYKKDTGLTMALSDETIKYLAGQIVDACELVNIRTFSDKE